MKRQRHFTFQEALNKLDITSENVNNESDEENTNGRASTSSSDRPNESASNWPNQSACDRQNDSGSDLPNDSAPDCPIESASDCPNESACDCQNECGSDDNELPPEEVLSDMEIFEEESDEDHAFLLMMAKYLTMKVWKMKIREK